MREFMEAVQKAFYDATGWNQDNSYSSLDVTTDGLLGFRTPQGLHMTLSSLATSQFATSYELGAVGVVDGSLSYLYSSVPIQKFLTAQSETVSLPSRMQSYRALSPLNTSIHNKNHGAKPATALRPALLYGRLYLPQSMLEALVIKKLSPALQVQLSAVSSKMLRNGGTVLGLAQYDVGRYEIEGLASSDGGLLGLRGVYNFHAHDEKAPLPPPGDGERERIYGRFSTGAEIYYGTLNKSGGISMGARFATLPEHTGTPLTATLTINPLMGSISASYAVMAGRFCSLGTRLDFNVYSYESDWLLGMELWRHGFAARETGLADSLAGERTILPPKSQAVVFPPAAAKSTPTTTSTSTGSGGQRSTEPVLVGTPGTNRPKMQAAAKKSAVGAASPHVATGPAGSGGSEGAQEFERSFQAKMQWRLDEQSSPLQQQQRKTTEAAAESPAFRSSPPLSAGAPFSPAALPSTPAAADVAQARGGDPSSLSPSSVAHSSNEPVPAAPAPAASIATADSTSSSAAPVAPPASKDSEEFGAVIKARLDQNMKIGLLWEGRVKALLFSLGFAIDLRKRDQPFRTVGLELQYSS